MQKFFLLKHEPPATGEDGEREKRGEQARSKPREAQPQPRTRAPTDAYDCTQDAIDRELLEAGDRSDDAPHDPRLVEHEHGEDVAEALGEAAHGLALADRDAEAVLEDEAVLGIVTGHGDSGKRLSDR